MVVGSADVDRSELVGVEAVLALELGNDLVAASLDAEAVHIVAAQHGAEVGADLLKVEAKRGDLVAVEGDLGLRLVVLQVGVGVDEDPAGKGRLHEFLRGLEELPWFHGRGDHELDGKVAASGKRWWSGRDDSDAGNSRRLPAKVEGDLLAAARPLLPRLGADAAHPAVGLDDLKGVTSFRNGIHGVVQEILVEQRLVDRGEGGGLHDGVEDGKHQDPESRDREDRAAMAEHRGQQVDIAELELGEVPVDPPGVAARVVAAPEEAGGHHRGEREGDDAGDQHRAGKGEGELAEERSGQPPLDADRGVDGRQGDRHRDDRTEEFATAPHGSMEGGEAGVEMALHVLHDDDRVIHHEADRQHDGEEGEEIDGEPEEGHDEGRPDQGNRDGDHRNDHRAERSEEQEDHEDDDGEGLGEGLEDLLDRVADVVGGVVGDLHRHPGGEELLEIGDGLPNALADF